MGFHHDMVVRWYCSIVLADIGSVLGGGSGYGAYGGCKIVFLILNLNLSLIWLCSVSWPLTKRCKFRRSYGPRNNFSGSYDESGPGNRMSYEATLTNLQSRYNEHHNSTFTNNITIIGDTCLVLDIVISQQVIRLGGGGGVGLQLQQLRACSRCRFNSKHRCCQLRHMKSKQRED